MKKYNYVYRITNNKLNKHYIGARSSNIEPHLDLGVKYFSSSSDKEFKQDQIDNKTNYSYYIIDIFATREESINLEVYLHDKYNVGINESFYNKCKQTSTKFDTTGLSFNKGMMAAKNIETSQIEYISTLIFYSSNKYIAVSKNYKMSDEQKLKISLSKIGISSQFKNMTFNERYGELKSNEIKNKMSFTFSKKIGILNNFFGKTHSNETKKKISEKNSNKAVFINDSNEKVYMNVDEAKMKNFIAESFGRKYTDEVNKKKGRKGELNHNFGKHLSKETKDKISASWFECREKLECPHCSKLVLKHHKRFHFENCKLKVKE